MSTNKTRKTDESVVDVDAIEPIESTEAPAKDTPTPAPTPNPMVETEGAVVKRAHTAGRKLLAKLRREPKVKVYGAPSFKKSEGPYYTFLFNGIPVTIKFDGTWQEFPSSIAEHLNRKLEKIAAALAPVEKEVKI